MQIIKQSYRLMTSYDAIRRIPAVIELAGRTCYKSEDKITEDSEDAFCRMLIKRGHEAMIEHGAITIRFITNRGVTHELVRHRLASFAQESTRYVKYDDIEFIEPVFDWVGKGVNAEFDGLDAVDAGDDDFTLLYYADPIAYQKLDMWHESMEEAEDRYRKLIDLGCSPQEAREVLPNSLKTEIVVTANVREWRHIFKLRCSASAHPQIRELMIPVRDKLIDLVPCLFEDLKA